MEKIAVTGKCRRDKITERYSGKAEIVFNPECADEKTKYEYSAVFLTQGAEAQDAEKWLGNEHLRIANTYEELISEIDFFLGIPRRYEIERKFLVEYPKKELLASLPLCSYVEISQAYVNKDRHRFRVRKRGKNGEFIYIKTEKIKISDMRRAETECRISRRDYEQAVRGERVLSKRRYLILYKDKCFELDVFPFWKDRALLEIELKSESEPFELPPYLNPIREVTAESEYRNSVIAGKYGVTADE